MGEGLQQIVIWGAGGHARVVADAIQAAGGWTVAGFLDDVHPERHGASFDTSPLLGGREQLPGLLRRGVEWAIVAIGDCAARLECTRLLAEAGYRLAVIAHPRAVVSPSAAIGGGTFVAAGAVVGPATSLGEAVIINTLASVDHDCALDDGVHVGPGARLAGGVRIGHGVLVGTGAVIVPDVSIGAGGVVGAGSVVLKDVPAGVVVCGNPAHVLREV